MGLLTFNELASGLGQPPPARPPTMQDLAWAAAQRHDPRTPIGRASLEAERATARADQAWLRLQRADPNSPVGRAGAAERAAAATRAKLAAAAQGQKFGWAVTSQSQRLMSPGEHYDLAVRRFKGLFYPQPKEWTVSSAGDSTPVHRVGTTWDREKIREAEREHLARLEVLRTHSYIYSEEGRRRKRELEQNALKRRLKAEADAAFRRRAAEAKARRQRDQILAMREQQRHGFQAPAPRQDPRGLVSPPPRPVAPRPAQIVLAAAQVKRPVITSYQAPKPTGGLVRASGAPTAAIGPGFFSALYDRLTR